MHMAAERLDESFSVEAALARIAHWLPSQGPLKDFIHHNTLHAFQNRPFHEGVAVAAEVYGAHSYLTIAEYRAALKEGRIDPKFLPPGIEEAADSEENPPPGYARGGLRSGWRDRGLDLDTLSHPMLFRLVSNFLDQGISLWRMPHATDTFWNAVRRIVDESFLPLEPLSGVTDMLKLTPEVAIPAALKKLVGKEELYEQYLLEMLLAHPGWSGMAGVIANNPAALLANRRLPLVDFVAVELLLELGWVQKKLGAAFAPLEPGPRLPRPEEMTPAPTRSLDIKRAWHEAYEKTLYDRFITKLEKHYAAGRPAAVAEPSAHAFFCIDDRECSVRRHLETLDPSILTSGTAGFFGVDWLFQRAGSLFPEQYCPVVLKPRHLVREIGTTEKKKEGGLWHPKSNTLFRGWLLTQTMGFAAILRLLRDVFSPTSKLLTDLTRVDSPTQLTLLRESDESTEGGYLVGYTVAEMADRVQGVLRSAGATRHLPQLAIFVAHGASSANNPHFAAYDCGACSGRPGAPNARAFATMANQKAVRALLQERGFRIPESTHFVGAMHDTTADRIEYFDVNLIPDSHRAAFDKFRATMNAALVHNAKERTRRFEMVSRNLTPAEAHKHVQERAASIFEPRPELNHATNAFAVVGRRELTRGLSLDRRAFLNSYDPTQDPQGDVLAGILGAVVPVCGGINLEYYFSRVDNEVYGAGTKLPHNVASLVGVANGVDGDLRTGLPSQMVEIHEAVRLLIVVEQEPEIALSAAKRNPAIWEWIENGWVHYACFSPSQGKVIRLGGES